MTDSAVLFINLFALGFGIVVSRYGKDVVSSGIYYLVGVFGAKLAIWGVLIISTIVAGLLKIL
ncbi:hypothetical protein HZC00_04930 [Candidatus Kaiserbacteria bacterium]|nr:hypothetical protein [Candidatus Kaiserbacteria bacterium]